MVGYLADIPAMPSTDEMDTYLSRLGINPCGHLKPEQLALTQAEATYCPDGTFMPERMIDYWRSFYRQASMELLREHVRPGTRVGYAKACPA